MIVVSDTTPLISLLKIEHLDLLKKLCLNKWVNSYRSSIYGICRNFFIKSARSCTIHSNYIIIL